MNKIVAPLKSGMSGAAVADLQDALLWGLERSLIRTFDAPDRPTIADLMSLGEGLKQDRILLLFGKATTTLLVHFQIQEGLGDHLGGVVDEATAARLNERLAALGLQTGSDNQSYIITGHIKGGRRDHRVRAYDCDFRSEEFLGDSPLNEKNRYEIRYDAERFQLAEKGGADLRIAVCADNGRELASSDITYNAKAITTIDLTLDSVAEPDAPSEYERYLAELEGILQGVSLLDIAGGTPPDQKRDIDFLAGDSGIERQHIAWLVQAARLARESLAGGLSTGVEVRVRVSVDQADAIPPEAFYGWLRMGLPSEWNALRTVKISRLRSALLEAVAASIVPRWLNDRGESILLRLPNPEFAALANLLQVASLPPEKIQAAFTRMDAVESVSDQLLKRLVDEKTLSAPEAERVGLTVSLHRLAAGDAAVVSSMLDSEFVSVSSGKLRHARDLALLEPAEWEPALERSGVPPPAGMSRQAHARALAMDAASAYPDVAFRQRAARLPANLDGQLETVKALLHSNKDALAVPFEALDLTPVAGVERKALREAHTALKDLANLHPGLGLHAVFSGANGSADSAQVAGERIGWLRTVFDLNPDLSFVDLDYLPGSVDLVTVDFGPLSKTAQEHVLADLKSHQRVHAVTDNAVPAQELMKAGFHSASAIALTRATDFADAADLPPAEASAYHTRAIERANEAAMYWFDIYTEARDGATTPIRSIPSREQFFKPLQGFAALINDQPWCECEKCQSVLSPAAYFVDLMHYVEENILTDSFKGQEGHLLHLQKRRQDLWDLDLSCKNTSEFVPYLDIVNEVLETYLREVIPLASTPALYQHLAEQDGSFKQPFLLPMERLETMLGHFGLSRYDIATTMDVAQDIRAQARLRLSSKQYQLITQARAADAPFLWALFKLPAPVGPASSDALLPAVEMATLLRATDLAHDLAAAALKTAFVGADGSSNAAIQIVLGKRNPDDLQNNSEVINNLSLKRLDRLHRFLRLWRQLPWTIDELDHVLARLAGAGQTAGIEPHGAAQPGTIERIVDLLELGETWSLQVDEVMAMTDKFPTRGLRHAVPLFDRLFNDPSTVSRDPKWPLAAEIRFSHPLWEKLHAPGAPASPLGVADPPDNTHMRLLSGLQLSDEDFVVLVAGLQALAAIDRQSATDVKHESISLSAASIGALYRHARVMRLLGYSAVDFIKLLKLTPRKASLPNDAMRYLNDLDDVASVIRFAAWQKKSGFTLDQIGQVTDPGDYVTAVATREGPRSPATLATDIIDKVKADSSLVFADTLFTQLGLTESESRATVLAQVGTGASTKPFEASPDGGYRLKAGSPGPVVTVPAVDPARLAALLQSYDPLHVLDVALGGILAVPPEQVQALRELADPLTSADATAVGRAMQGSAVDQGRLTRLVAQTLRYHALFKHQAFDLTALQFVSDHLDVFGLAADPAQRIPTPEVVRHVAAYAALATPTDTGFTTASGPADIVALHTVLVGVGAANAEALAKALRADASNVGVLMPHLPSLPSDPFDALDLIARSLALAKELGVGAETLALSLGEASNAAANFNVLSRAAEDFVAAIRAKYPLEKVLRDKLEPYEDKLRGRKRDALVDYLVTRWPEPFADPGKLYEYFLIDVMLQGCARTSLVVAAISSVQLYVHRVLMNLERSSDWDGLVPPKKGVFAHFTHAAKREEWTWRKHFRVWEANRKVFLYPENYIEPELRDDKTPLFKELEDTLLLQEIDPSNVHDAYSHYLTGFDELAHLKIAGSYYDAAAQKLHLFGVTQDDAPVYYYREIDEAESTPTRPLPARFSAWHKLNVQIPARKVSPIPLEGRMYLFWLETATRPVNSFTGGTSAFSGYRHTVRVKYSTLQLDGGWSPPKIVSLIESGGTGESRIVEDPLDTTRRDQIDAELARLKLDLDARQKDESEAIAERGPIAKTASEAGILTGVRRKEFDDSPTPPEVAASIAAGVFLGPHAAERVLADFKFGHSLLLLKAIREESEANENLRIANDTLATAQQRVRSITDQMTVLQNERTKKILVRWDKSKRDHKEALDSYKPEGWEWDRVYPDVYGPPNGPQTIRLMLVPRNDPVPMRGLMTLSSSDFDENPAVLRPMASEGGPPSGVTATTKTNWSEGKLQTVTTLQPNAGPLDFVAFGLAYAAYPGQRFYEASFWLNQLLLTGSTEAIAPATSDVQIVNGETDSVIIESQGDSVWMRKSPASKYIGTRIGTRLTPTLMNEFWRGGPSRLLDASFQETKLKEIRSKISPVAGQGDPARANPFHPESPCLTYFRETFFHIPFLIANHLNSQQDFSETQRWYHTIFDPTAAQGDPWRYREFRSPDPVTQTLRAMLVDPIALDAYRKDRFNPHAIARTRMSAYQKSVVMKYIDNLLDWGDSLFNQFTTESINEATMLYVMAQDILGPRPRVLGSCGEGKVVPKTYRKIRPGLNQVSDFLIELEAPSRKQVVGIAKDVVLVIENMSILTSAQASATAAPALADRLDMAPTVVSAQRPAIQTPLAANDLRNPGGGYWTSVGGTPVQSAHIAASGDGRSLTLDAGGGLPPIPPAVGGDIDFINPKDAGGGMVGVRGGEQLKPFGRLDPTRGFEIDVKHDLHDTRSPDFVRPGRKIPVPDVEPVKMVPPKNAVFCIPPNKDLLAYWSRVEDRLFKIRNCMDILGVRRRVELFAPEIDPRLLVRMKQAGLTLEDVLNSTSGNLPPYRFTYLIDKAKQYAGTLQSFGAQLSSALEKRDGEELSHLRAVHEQNLLKMRTKLMQLEIKAAEDTIEGLRRQRDGIEYRQTHFRTLFENGQNPSERKQQQLQREASGYRTQAGIAQVVASMLTIIPDVGAPTSMKFGGSQLGAAGRAMAEGLNAVAAFNEVGASLAGVEASNQRRDEEWKHQVEIAKREIAQLEKSITAAEIRRDIALHSFEVHERTIEQTEEMFEFFREKFTSIDRYRLLSNELRRLHRMAFNSALSVAKLAEQAFRAERTDDDSALSGNYWDANHAGLLAGERLLVDLQRLEQNFIESNYRQLEIEQSFSLAQFAPEALATLQRTGECGFKVPEWFFDLFYPGQYRRRLKAVRLTIPCVTGPYANVGATLRLEESSIRLTPPDPDQAALDVPTPVPLRHTVSMATSKAQYDAGVFDFSFRDERYMPFEGAGAIGTWQVSLPNTIRVFDYGSVNDVVLHLSYTADFSEGLKSRWDGAAQKLIELLGSETLEPPMTRLFSLRHEFPDAYHRLVTSREDTEVSLTIEPRHFPLFLAGRKLQASTAWLRILSPLGELKAATGLQGASLGIGRKAVLPEQQVFKQVDAPKVPTAKGPGDQIREFICGDVLANPAAAPGLSSALIGDYLIKITKAGPLATALDTEAIDPQKLRDIVLEVAYRLAPEAL